MSIQHSTSFKDLILPDESHFCVRYIQYMGDKIFHHIMGNKISYSNSLCGCMSYFHCISVSFLFELFSIFTIHLT